MLFTFGLILCIYASHVDGGCEDDPDYEKDTYQLIANKKYPVERYNVVTSDHYVLTIFRIPNGNGYNGNSTQKPIMLLAHGLLGSSSNWVDNLPNQSLAFIAYDKGYDVWIANFRGNTYARTNTLIKNTDPVFWLFSFDQPAQIDLPSIIDYILNKTQQSAVYCVGHSEGTTIILAMLASKTEYQKKVLKAALLAPVAAVYNSPNPIFQLAALKDLLPLMATLTSGTYGELFPNSAALHAFIDVFCKNSTDELCKELSGYLFSLVEPEYNSSRYCVYAYDFPAGSSAYTAVHYAQERDALVFRMYDHGVFVNFLVYGQATPPDYNLALIETPIGLYSSSVDTVADQKDIDFIRENLGTPPYDDLVINDRPDFGHSAFVIGVNAPEVVYKQLLAKLPK